MSQHNPPSNAVDHYKRVPRPLSNPSVNVQFDSWSRMESNRFFSSALIFLKNPRSSILVHTIISDNAGNNAATQGLFNNHTSYDTRWTTRVACATHLLNLRLQSSPRSQIKMSTRELEILFRLGKHSDYSLTHPTSRLNSVKVVNDAKFRSVALHAVSFGVLYTSSMLLSNVSEGVALHTFSFVRDAEMSRVHTYNITTHIVLKRKQLWVIEKAMQLYLRSIPCTILFSSQSRRNSSFHRGIFVSSIPDDRVAICAGRFRHPHKVGGNENLFCYALDVEAALIYNDGGSGSTRSESRGSLWEREDSACGCPDGDTCGAKNCRMRQAVEPWAVEDKSYPRCSAGETLPAVNNRVPAHPTQPRLPAAGAKRPRGVQEGAAHKLGPRAVMPSLKQADDRNLCNRSRHLKRVTCGLDAINGLDLRNNGPWSPPHRKRTLRCPGSPGSPGLPGRPWAQRSASTRQNSSAHQQSARCVSSQRADTDATPSATPSQPRPLPRVAQDQDAYDNCDMVAPEQTPPSDPTQHRRKRGAQWRRWQLEVIPTVLPHFTRVLHATKPLRHCTDLPLPTASLGSCACKTSRVCKIAIIQFSSVDDAQLRICSCSPAAVQLIQCGAFPCTPLAPTLAVDLRVLEFTMNLFLQITPNNTAFSTTLERCLGAMGFQLQHQNSLRRRFGNCLMWYIHLRTQMKASYDKIVQVARVRHLGVTDVPPEPAPPGNSTPQPRETLHPATPDYASSPMPAARGRQAQWEPRPHNYSVDVLPCIDACFTQTRAKAKGQGGRDPPRTHPHTHFVDEDDAARTEAYVDGVQNEQTKRDKQAKCHKAMRDALEEEDGYEHPLLH
ncbi:hypothetical protein FB451DRAFT_1373547 [Mycena latifolia]|nr:hypothetical protein FB451DRAFT_1373547 [Mycena latifolia]